LLNFKFLLFDGLSEEVWNQLFCECFCNKLKAAGATYETVEWREVGQKVPKVSILRDLVIKGGHKFNTERLFARFYLPYIFTKPHTTRMFYVDNDAVVTADLSVFATEAYNMTVTDHRTGNSSSAAVGFVYDKAIFNKFYMATHFHLTHPLVAAAKSLHGEKFYYNGGVMLIDTREWLRQNLTQRAEDLFRINAQLIAETDGKFPLYDMVVGDQGVFYMMLEAVSYLPARYNMRRHPVKTVTLLNDNSTTGIVHFAGTDGHVGLEMLCRWPFHYPAYRAAALPLFLSVYGSLDRKCHFSRTFASFVSKKKAAQASDREGEVVWAWGPPGGDGEKKQEQHIHKLPELGLCDIRAVALLKEELDKAEIQVIYNPGAAGREFMWPPPPMA